MSETYNSLRARVEQLHQHHKAKESELETRVAELEKTDIKHDARLRANTSRLDDGSKTISGIKDAMRPPSPWRLLPYAAMVMVFIGGIIWMAAKYPDRAQMKTAIEERAPYVRDKDRIMRAVDAYETTVPSLLLQMGVINVKLDNISAQLKELKER